MVFKLARCYATTVQTPPFCDNTAVPPRPPVQIGRPHWRGRRQENSAILALLTTQSASKINAAPLYTLPPPVVFEYKPE